MCSSGDQTAKASEQASFGLQQRMADIFEKQYADQKELRDFAVPYLKGQVVHPAGYSPEGLTAMRSSATDQVAQATAQARQAAQLSETGFSEGDLLPSGVAAQINAGIDVAGAQQNATVQNQITQQNEQLKLANYWKAIGALAGQQELEAPQSYANAATSAGNSVANLSQAVLASQQAGWANVGGIISGIGGLATGAGAIGTGFGFGKG